MKKLLIIISLFTISLAAHSKKYPFDMQHEYKVEQIRVAQDGSRFIKVWGEGNNADKAIIQALQDAVACCIFKGLAGVSSTTGHNAPAVPPLCRDGLQSYDQNKAYFDKFFTNGDFLQYAVNSNKRYPTGENNVAVKGGRRVGIYVQLKVDDLRRQLEDDGIIQSLDNIWK